MKKKKTLDVGEDGEDGKKKKRRGTDGAQSTGAGLVFILFLLRSWLETLVVLYDKSQRIDGVNTMEEVTRDNDHD
jgi:hypothetical protein